MSDDLEINIGTKMAESLRAFAELNKSVATLVSKVDAVGKESQKTDQINRRLGEYAKQTWDSTRTAAEKASLEQAKFNKLLKDGSIDFDTFKRASSQFGVQSQTMFGRVKEWGASTAGQIIGATTATGAFLAALRMVGQELDANARRQDAAAAQARGESNPLRTLGLAVGSGADMNTTQAAEQVGLIAEKTKAKRGAIFTASAIAGSARGTKRTMSDAFPYVEAAARMNPGADGVEIGTIAGGALSLTQNEAGTPEQAIGLMYQGMKNARISNPMQYATGVVPGVLSMQKSGASAQEAMALLGALSLETGDATGSQSATAGVQLLSQVDEAVRTADPSVRGVEAQRKFLFETDVGRRIRDALVGPLSARIGDGKRLSKKLKPDELHGEEKTRAAMIEWLTPGSQTSRTYEAGLSSIPDMAGAGGAYADLLAQQKATPGLRSTEIREAGEAAVESLRNNAGAQSISEMRQQVNAIRAEDPSHYEASKWARQKVFDGRMSIGGVTESDASQIALSELETFMPMQARIQRDRNPNYSAQSDPLLSDAQKALIKSIDDLRATIERQQSGGRGSSTNGSVPQLQRAP